MVKKLVSIKNIYFLLTGVIIGLGVLFFMHNNKNITILKLPSQKVDISIDIKPTETPTDTPTPMPITKRKWFDVIYANRSEKEKMDIYLPPSELGPFPVIILIHGGGFIEGDKNDTSMELKNIPAALNRGYAVVSVNYRLGGEALFPAQIYDIKAAIRYVRANSAEYHLNTIKIAAWGGSAGGTLAALAGTSGQVADLEDYTLGNANQSSRVQAVIDWYGPINFLTIDAQFRKSGITPGFLYNDTNSPESQVLGNQITKIPNLVEKFDPETYITSDDPPFFIQHGTNDHLVPVQQSENFAKQLSNVIGSESVVYETIIGADHASVEFNSPENIKKVLDFLDKYLK